MGLKSGRLSAPGEAGRDLRPGDARGGGSQARAGPRPTRAPQGHSPPRAGHLSARHVLLPVLPPGSPGWGGNRRQRLDSASLAAGSSGGGVGLGGKRRATRCVGQRSSGQSVTPRAPGPGWGGPAESAPRGGREPRGPSGARGWAGAGRRGKGLVLRVESGASGCARELSQGPVPAPHRSPSTRA